MLKKIEEKIKNGKQISISWDMAQCILMVYIGLLFGAILTVAYLQNPGGALWL